jgi:hypothetical protein|tara:strand:+ start:98 stop:457 length:360 start_codon:yes stop_codon:yes gene_type:complete
MKYDLDRNVVDGRKDTKLHILIGEGYTSIEDWEEKQIYVSANTIFSSIDKDTTFLDLAKKISKIHAVKDCMVSFDFFSSGRSGIQIYIKYLGKKMKCCGINLLSDFKFCPICCKDVKMV